MIVYASKGYCPNTLFKLPYAHLLYFVVTRLIFELLRHLDLPRVVEAQKGKSLGNPHILPQFAGDTPFKGQLIQRRRMVFHA